MPRVAAPSDRSASMHDAVHPARPPVGETAHQMREESWPAQFVPATNMPNIPARPGMVQKWVRDPITQDSQETSWSRSYGENWRPRDPATVPPGATYRTGKNIHGNDCIRRGNSVLCEMPEYLWKQREELYAQRSKGQYAARMKEADSGLANMRHDDELTVTVGHRVGVSPMTD